MPSWPKEPKVIGKRIDRVDGPLKVKGEAKYASDVQPKGWLFGMILRSPWPHAKIHSIDLSRAKKIRGVQAAILSQEGEFTARYYGQELAAVAGTTKQVCEDALSQIQIDATPLPFVVHEEKAVKPDSPQVFQGYPNLGEPRVKEEGDVNEAFAQAAFIVEGFFKTPVQLHNSLETHGNTAASEGGELTVWSSTQGIFSVRDGLARNLDMPESKIRVLSDFMGGGFGSKFGPGVEGVLVARLTMEAGAPVKLMLPRFDEMKAVGNRPSSFQKIRLGADREGKLLAYELEAFGTSGYAGGPSSEGGGGRAGFPAPYLYEIPNIRVSQTGVAINAGSSRAYRAPGHPQASFGMESIMDELAVKMGMDPLDLRLKNDPDETRQKEWRLAAKHFRWTENYRPPGSSPGVVKSGIGLGGATWGGGGRGTKAEVEINADGSVEVRCGTQDLGTGTRTLMAIVAAEVFGLNPSAITARLGDTHFPPSGGSGGSTTAASVTPAVYDACHNALKELKEISGMQNPIGPNWSTACGKLGVNPLVAHGEWEKGLSSRGVGGVQMAEVEVDTETGFVRVKRVLCVQDCGLVLSRKTCESQVYGGIIGGIGYALFEERIMDGASGIVLNPNFETYKIPGAQDMPDIEVVLFDMPERGVIGIGEPTTIPTAAAIANAVANAIGKRVTSLPITPDKVLAALGRVQEGKMDLAFNDSQNLFSQIFQSPA